MTSPIQLHLDISGLARPARSQLLYALNFCDTRVVGVHELGDKLVVECMDFDADTLDRSGEPMMDAIQRKVELLIKRFDQPEPALKDEVFFKTGPLLDALADPYDTLVELGMVVPLAAGRCVLRGWFAQLVDFIDAEACRRVAVPLQAEPERYPNAIEAAVLAKTMHLSSFPEHLHFVSHLESDLSVLEPFAECARSSGWSEQLAEQARRAAAQPALIMNPSVCYHCYAARAGTSVPDDGLTITARSRCHRYEGGALSGLRRLSDFDMREVIFLGRPEDVKARRDQAESLIRAWAEEWGLSTEMVNANDPFFTSDYEVKAAFQRRQDLKHEFTVPMPDGRPMAISSSNFHSVTFGKAFEITRRGRPACTGCIGFGLERWAYAVCIQFGVEPASWPVALARGFAEFVASGR